MKTLISFLFLLPVFFVGAAQSNNDNNQLKITASNFSKVDQFAKQLLKTAKLPAISIAVAKKGELLYAKSFGMADLENNIPATITTRFRTASVAKIISATAIGRLVSEGLLDLDTPIKKYVPYINEELAPVTARQLLGQLSGVRHRPRKSKNKVYTTKEAVKLFHESPLQFSPGTDYQYSTNGFTLLAAIIEGVTGKTYLDYMKEDIFDPLEMSNTKGEILKELNKQDAALYYFKKGELRLETRLNDPSYKMAGAGFRTTPSDLVKMMNAYSNGLINEEVVQEMFTTQHLKDGIPTQVGLTWRMNVDPFGRTLVDHAGSWQGARTVVCYYPAEQLSIAIMVNASWHGLIEETAQMMATIFFNQDSPTSIPDQYDGKLNAKFSTVQNVSEFTGTLKLKDGKGELIFDTAIDFLQHVPLIQLNTTNDYAAFTSFGILYLKMESAEKRSGKLYWYQTRNSENPTHENPILSF